MLDCIKLKDLSTFRKLVLYGFEDEPSMMNKLSQSLEKVNYVRGEASTIIRYCGRVIDIPMPLLGDWLEEKVVQGEYLYKDYNGQGVYLKDAKASFLTARNALKTSNYILILQEETGNTVRTVYKEPMGPLPASLNKVYGRKKAVFKPIKPNNPKPIYIQTSLMDKDQQNNTTNNISKDHKSDKEKKNVELYNKYLAFLNILFSNTQNFSMLSIPSYCKKHNVDKRIVSILVRDNILTIKGSKNKAYKWAGGRPSLEMVDKVVRAMRLSRKKHLKTGKQQVKGYKKGTFTQEEENLFIEMVRQGCSYDTMCKRLNRTKKLLSKHKYRLKIKGVDLTLYEKPEETLFSNNELETKKEKLQEGLKNSFKSNPVKIADINKNTIKNEKLYNKTFLDNHNDTLSELETIYKLLGEKKISKEIITQHVKARIDKLKTKIN